MSYPWCRHRLTECRPQSQDFCSAVPVRRNLPLHPRAPNCTAVCGTALWCAVLRRRATLHCVWGTARECAAKYCSERYSVLLHGIVRHCSGRRVAAVACAAPGRLLLPPTGGLTPRCVAPARRGREGRPQVGLYLPPPLLNPASSSVGRLTGPRVGSSGFPHRLTGSPAAHTQVLRNYLDTRGSWQSFRLYSRSNKSL